MVSICSSALWWPRPALRCSPAGWWARAVGIVLAALSAIANFLFLPYSPVWSVLIIALDVFVILGADRARADVSSVTVRRSAAVDGPSVPGPFVAGGATPAEPVRRG